MEDDFLRDFNIMDTPIPSTPIFAKKSAPPPPTEDGSKSNMVGNMGSGSPAFSTPSSSLLDTSNENSSAVANSANPSPALPPHVGDQSADVEEPMEQDLDSTPRPAASQSGTQKKARNRSRAQRPEGKKSGPDVPSLLAALEDPNLPPLPPPLPSPQPIPPPPPLPPSPLTGAGVAPPIKKNPRAKRGEKEKKNDEQKAKSAQRTLGRIPRLPKHNNDCSGTDPTGNNDIAQPEQQPDQHGETAGSGTPDAPTPSSASHSGSTPGTANSTDPQATLFANTPSSGGELGQPQQQHQQNQQNGNKRTTAPTAPTQSAYNVRPNAADNICMDISSYRFVPEDDKRIAILLRKMKGDSEGRTPDGSTLRHVIHQFPTVFSNEVTGIPLDEAPGASLFREDNNNKFLSIAEFATVEHHIAATFHTIARREALVFVIVSRHEQARGKLSWDIPSLAICQDFSNDFISRAFEGDNWDWTRSYIRSGRWGKVGTVILSSDSVEKLSEFRRQFALHTYKNMAFDTYPKDVLTAKADVSILLRSSMKTFKTEMIPKILFARNQEIIAGSLRVLSTRHHAADEKSHKGESKENWRSIELKGNDQFMRCLRLIPENQALLLGYDAIQIRGGLRPQDHNVAAVVGSKRAWSDIPAASTPLLQDPRNPTPSTSASAAATATPLGQTSRPSFDENAPRGSFKRGRAARGSNRRRGRGRFGRN